MIRYIGIVLILLCYNLANAQTFGGGVFGGLSASQLDGDKSGGYNKAGVSFGMYTNAHLTKFVGAQLELKYIQKGSKWEENDVTFYHSKLNYIELPLFLKYRFLDKFSANIGLAVGYLQKSTENKDGIGDEPADPPFNEFEFSGLAGVEYEFLQNFYFNVRFNYSILPVRDHPGDQTFFVNRGQYNNALTFAVYYQIANFGK